MLGLCLLLCLGFAVKVRAGITLDADKDGSITWESEPTMATSNIIWETSGYLIYSRETPDGDPLSSGLPYARIEVDDRNVQRNTEYDPVRGKYVTHNRISAEYVRSAITGNEELYSDFMKQAKLGKACIYLNAYFSTYSVDGRGNRTLLSADLYSREAIKSDRAWRNKAEWNKGRGYYNVPVEYKVTGNVEFKLTDAAGRLIGGGAKVKGDGQLRSNPYDMYEEEGSESDFVYRQEAYVGSVVSAVLPTIVEHAGIRYRLYQSYVEDAGSKKRDIRQPGNTREIVIGLEKKSVVGQYREAKDTSDEAKSMSEQIGRPFCSAVIGEGTLEYSEFDAKTAMPSGEDVYVSVRAPEHIMGYSFVRDQGKVRFTVTGRVTWQLTWTAGTAKKPQVMHSTVTSYYPVTLERSFSYWRIEDLKLYGISSASVNNAAITHGSCTVAARGQHIPSVDCTSMPERDAHVKLPSAANGVVDLGVRSFNASSPPGYNAYYEIDALVSECSVRNDRLLIDGEVIMDDCFSAGKTPMPKTPVCIPEPCGPKVMYAAGIKVPKEKKNGTYASFGTVTYDLLYSAFAGSSGTLTFAIDSADPVSIHTPTVCRGVIDDARAFCELTAPQEERKQLVLEREFTVKINTVGAHRSIKGYGFRDFEKYTEAFEVCFPFEVLHNGKLTDAGTWIDIGGGEKFKMPPAVKEGEYTVAFRSIAYNGEGDLTERTEPSANLNYYNYTATDNVDVYVSGRLYGLKIDKIIDEAVWKTAGEYDFAAGIKNRDGAVTFRSENRTFPMIGGDHPIFQSEGILKKGYRISFSMECVGDVERYDSVTITPSYYYREDEQGEWKAADVYFMGRSSADPIVLEKSRRSIYPSGRYAKFSGELSVPADAAICKKGYPVSEYVAEHGRLNYREDFWIRKGQMLLRLDITLSRDGRSYYSYINLQNEKNGYCNMWRTEGGVKSRTDNAGTVYRFGCGDFVIYDIGKDLWDDVRSVTIY